MNLQLNSIQYPVYNLGPGKRIGIWVQGCTLKCGNCISKSLWDQKGGSSVSVEDVFAFIKKNESGFDGITISGGEPFQQYTPLMALLLMVKKFTRLNTLCYSGYTLDELNIKFPDQAFFKLTDYLVDGRYDSHLHYDKGMKGSSNQKLYEFSNGDVRVKKDSFQSHKWSVLFQPDNTVRMVGVPKKNEMPELKNKLKKDGILIALE